VLRRHGGAPPWWQATAGESLGLGAERGEDLRSSGRTVSLAVGVLLMPFESVFAPEFSSARSTLARFLPGMRLLVDFKVITSGEPFAFAFAFAAHPTHMDGPPFAGAGALPVPALPQKVLARLAAGLVHCSHVLLGESSAAVLALVGFLPCVGAFMDFADVGPAKLFGAVPAREGLLPCVAPGVKRVPPRAAECSGAEPTREDFLCNISARHRGSAGAASVIFAAAGAITLRLGEIFWAGRGSKSGGGCDGATRGAKL